jgi:hypothetical protein
LASAPAVLIGSGIAVVLAALVGIASKGLKAL